MKAFITEMIVFFAFFALTLVSYVLAKHAEKKRKAKQQNLSALAAQVVREQRQNFAKRMFFKHAPRGLIFLAVGAAQASPIAYHSVREYAVHLVVYSGYIIKH